MVYEWILRHEFCNLIVLGSGVLQKKVGRISFKLNAYEHDDVATVTKTFRAILFCDTNMEN